MAFIPHTDADREAMMRAAGVAGVEDLFLDVPAAKRFPKLNLPEPLSESEVLAELAEMADRNSSLDRHPCFLGAGAYNHFVPSVVKHMLLRGEFYTAYTPYQPEVSQGTLQAIFEYQSMVCDLTGMGPPTPRTTTAPPRWRKRSSWQSASIAAGAPRRSSRAWCTPSTGRRPAPTPREWISRWYVTATRASRCRT